MSKVFWTSSLLLLSIALCPAAMAAPCPVPNAIANGQVADASKIMENFNSVSNCAQQGVTVTGTPVAGSISVFSGPGSIMGGNLTGDVTTSGTTVTTLLNTGVIASTYINPTLTVDSKGRITNAINGTTGTGGGGAIPVLVQATGVRSASNSQATLSASFTSTPLPGNLLIAIIAGFSNGSNLDCPNSFLPAVDLQNAVANQGVLICARKVLSGDGAAYSTTITSPNGGATFSLLEFAGASGVSSSWVRGRQSGSSWKIFGSVRGQASYTIGIAESDSVNAYSNISGGTVYLMEHHLMAAQLTIPR